MLDRKENYVIISKLIAADAVIAQSVERVIGNDEVGSSNLPNSSKQFPTNVGSCFFACSFTEVFELPTSAEGDSMATDVGCEAANIRQFKSA